VDCIVPLLICACTHVDAVDQHCHSALNNVKCNKEQSYNQGGTGKFTKFVTQASVGASICIAAKLAFGMLKLLCRFGDWSVKETDWLNSNPCISGKPVVYLINLNEDKFIKKKSKWLPKVIQAALLHTTPVVTNMQETGFVKRL